MNDKEIKVNRLLDAIGEIDDDLLYEAQTYRGRKKHRFNFGLVAASMVLLIILAAAVPLVWRMAELLPNDASPSTSVVEVALDSVMSELEVGDYKIYASAEELSYLGQAQIVWQYSDGGEIYSKPLTKNELSRLEKNMGKGEDTGSTSPALKCKVWILDGRGNVKTPYLKDSSGNIGCQIFDYDAEIIPSDSMVECISDIVN